MEYNDFEDFVSKCDNIKTNYQEQTLKRLLRPLKYRNYVYSKEMSESKKDRIWEYINDDIEKEILDKIVSNLIVNQLKRKVENTATCNLTIKSIIID